MTLTTKAFIFLICSAFFVKVSAKSLRNIHSHGFYRFFAFEGILILLLLNESYWFNDPFSIAHIASWIFLVVSPLIVISGLYYLKKIGGHKERGTKTNLHFEDTENLVTVGIYKYICHPMYSSLFFLNWGIALKQITPLTLVLATIVSLFLYASAKVEERENIDHFGDEYVVYLKKVKKFIPFIF